MLVGEIGYRAYVAVYKPLHRPSDIYGLLWEPTPGAEKVIDGIKYKINKFGMRDYEYDRDKPKGVFRIAVIGDSVTWGVTEMAFTYPNLMENALKDRFRGKEIEVLNFGIQGTNTKHHRQILGKRVIRFHPDLVILGYCLNDMKLSRINPFLLWVTEHFDFANYIVVKGIRLLRVLQARFGIVTDDSYFNMIAGLFKDSQRVSRLRELLRDMKEMTANNGMDFVLAVFPFKQQFGRSPNLQPQQVVLQICKDEGIKAVDVLPELKRYIADMLYLEGDVVHFSEQGNAVITYALINFLEKNGYLDVLSGATAPL